jgi:hypothetical protein
MKGVAIEQVILLVLGVIVLALIGYLLYSNYLSTSGGISLEQCKTQLVNACGNCKLKEGAAWDSTDATTTDECGPIQKGCIAPLICQLSITYSYFDGITSGCSGNAVGGISTATGKFAPATCGMLGVS